tara:strand:+ start:4295 stop:7189 length:2895 start_codon:yes stop_codon:yes gene_type:complete
MYRNIKNCPEPKYMLLLLFFALGISTINGQQGKELRLRDTLLLDSSILYGRLSNGFTYYIKDLPNATEKINMRFYVKVGNHYQKPQQLEFAHAIEHLAFKCAKDFPVNLLDDSGLLNGLGMSKKDLYAQTWNFSTWYRFDVPSDRIDAVEKGFQWFGNISNLNLTKEAIEKEKGPLRQELVYRQGNDLEGFFLRTKLNSLLFPCNNEFSNFFEHNKTYSPDSLRSFYEQWYKPDRMAAIIVGDLANIKDIENQVKLNFSNIKGSSTQDKWSACNEEYFLADKNFASLQRDADINGNKEEVQIFLYWRDPTTIKQQHSWDGLQRNLIWRILLKLINNRLKEGSKAYGTSFFAYFNQPTYNLPAFEIAITTRIKQEQEAINKVIKILRQLKMLGVTQEVWGKIKNEYASIMELEDSTKSGYWLEHIQEHFVYGEALPANKNAHLKKWLLQLSLKEFNEYCSEFLGGMPNDIGIMAPEGKMYTDDQVRDWIQDALSKKVTRYSSPKVPTELLNYEDRSSLNNVGYKHKGTDISGAKEFVLNNGVRVILDTLAHNKDRFYLQGFRPKGASCFAQDDYFSAINAPSIIQNAGAGNFDKFAIDRFLKEKGKGLWIRPYIDYNESGIKGKSTVADMEKMLQLVYLYFVQPNKNEEAFKDWQMEERSRHLNPSYGIINADFNVLIRHFLGDSSQAPEGTVRLKGISQTDMNTAYRIYREIYNNASDFTFILSGSFSETEVLPLLQKYLGNLPSRTDSFSWKPEKTGKKMLPQGPIQKRFFSQEIGANYGMQSIQLYFRYISKVDKPLDWKEQLNIEVLGLLLDSKIRELRFSTEGGLYNMQALGSFNREFLYYDVGILLDVIPKELEMLRKAFKQIVSEIQRESFSQELFEEVMHSRVHPRYALSRQENSVRRGEKLYVHYRYDEPWIDPVKIEKYLEALTPGDIQKAAQKYLREDDRMEFTFQNGNNYSQK